MSATQSKPGPPNWNKAETYRSWLGKTTEKSAGATLIELGITVAEAESRASIPGTCSRCRGYRNPRNSNAQCPNVFCSDQCEQEFVRAAVATLSIDDCVRIHGRLEALLMNVEEPAANEW
jgi:hypothetical protein